MRTGSTFAGAKATTVERRGLARPPVADPPVGPVLSWIPGDGGGGRGGGEDFMSNYFGLWLWPLPPANTIEFAVEWPFGGIGLTIVKLDGAAIRTRPGMTDPWCKPWA